MRGRALVEACTEWVCAQGRAVLALSARAANSHALNVYHHLGFVSEDVMLVKLLDLSSAE